MKFCEFTVFGSVVRALDLFQYDLGWFPARCGNFVNYALYLLRLSCRKTLFNLSLYFIGIKSSNGSEIHVKKRLVWFRFKDLSIDEMVGAWCFGCLSGPPGFTCWISFAPVFSLIYCWALILALSPCYILIYMF